MLEDPRFFLDNWEQGETVRAVSQWEDVSYQVFSDHFSLTLAKKTICARPRFVAAGRCSLGIK